MGGSFVCVSSTKHVNWHIVEVSEPQLPIQHDYVCSVMSLVCTSSGIDL